MSAPHNTLAQTRWVKGMPSPNPGGRPKAIAEIEIALDREHRTVANMLQVFDRLRQLATEEAERVIGVDRDGEPVKVSTPPHPAFMKLYLERVLGPVKEDDAAKLQRQARELLDAMLEEARARRSAAGG